MEERRKVPDSPFIPSSGLNTIEMSPNEQIYDCKICENSFSSPIQSTIHYVTSHRLVPCLECLLLFLNRSDLDDHNRLKHANDATNCSQCPMTFASDRLLVDHLHEIHQKKNCQMCSALVKSSAIDTLQRHVVHVHKIPRQINSNDSVFVFDNNLSANGSFECLICREQFQMHRLFTHSLSFHKFSLGFIFGNILEKRNTSPLLRVVENAEKAGDYDANTSCTICKYKFTPLAPKILHSIYCHGLRVCGWCYGQFDNDEDFDAHGSSCDLALNADLGRCQFCDEDDTDDQDHLSRVHRIDQAIHSEKISNLYSVQQTSWIATNYPCNFCGETLSSVVRNIDGLIKHFVIHHKFSQNSILMLLKKSVVHLARDAANDKRRKLPFEEVEALNMKSSDGGGVIFDFDSKMVKVIYSSATDSDSSGTEEQEESPSTRPAYDCMFCPFKTAVKCMLAMHLSQKHGFTPKIEDNRCNACKKVFTSHVNLQRHYKNVHHKGNATHHKCPFCPISMRGKQKMRSHIALHVESSYHPCSIREIGFNCKYCHYSFWMADKLNEHMFNRHSDKFQQNFLMCSICAATFINKTSLRQHRDTKHPTVNGFTTFLYQCKLCFTTHIDIDEIRTHMADTHPELRSSYCAESQCRQYVDGNGSFEAHYARFHSRKIFKCTECPKIFETKLYATKHYEESHDSVKRLKQN